MQSGSDLFTNLPCCRGEAAGVIRPWRALFSRGALAAGRKARAGFTTKSAAAAVSRRAVLARILCASWLWGLGRGVVEVDVC